MMQVIESNYYKYCFNCCKVTDDAMELVFSADSDDDINTGFSITLCKKCRCKLISSLHQSIEEAGN